MNKKTQKNKQYVDKNPIESFKDLSGSIAKTAVDQGKKSMDDFWSQLLGSETRSYAEQNAGDLSEGQELDLKSLKKKTEEVDSMLNVMPGIDYRREIVHAESRITSENQRELDVKVQEVMIEIRKLITSSKELQAQFKEVAVEQRVVKAGKYHVNFFEWVIAVVKTARMKIEDSQNWLSTFKSKKNKKQYWNMFKKHGTTFGLSNERVVATQTG